MRKGLEKFMRMTALLLMLTMLTACASAQEGVPPESIAPQAEATEQPRPEAQVLTELKNGLEWTEDVSFSNFKAVTLDGQVVNQELFAGHRLTMINIWATYCNPCIAEMPYLAQLNKEYEEGEFQVVGLVVDMLDTDGSIHPMAVEMAWLIADATGADYLHMLPTDDLIRAKLQYLYSVPETVFVDSQGNIVTPDKSYIGARDYDGWKAIVDELLAGLPQEEATEEGAKEEG